MQEDRDRMFFISVIPWLSFTSVDHLRNAMNDSVPIITLGKIYEENGKIKLPFGIQVHHGLVDGFHVGKLVEGMEDLLCKDRLKRVS